MIGPPASLTRTGRQPSLPGAERAWTAGGTTMPDTLRVIARFIDGRILKGTTQDFFPNRPSFHLIPPNGGAPAELRCKDLKAVFIVKDLAGDPNRKGTRGFETRGPAAQGKPVAVRFRDGELLCGYSLSFMPDRDGFFLHPADPASNNLRVYVLTAAAAEIKAGPAAEALAQKVIAEQDDRGKAS